MISFSLTDEQKAILETVHKFALNELRARARECEEGGEIPENILKKAHQMGLGILDIPEGYGGQGLDFLTRILVQEELAWGDAGISCSLGGPGLAAFPILELGTEEQKRRHLLPFSKPQSYKMRGALALNEPEAGGDLATLRTRVKLEGDWYLLEGRKCLIYNGGVADLHVVFAYLEGEPAAQSVRGLVLEGRPEGMELIRKEDKLGLVSAHTGDITFNNCRVPKANLLGNGEDIGAPILRFMDKVKLLAAAQLIGVAQAAQQYCADYAKERVAFSRPIAQFQAISFMVADMAIEIEAARMLTWKAAWLIDKGSRVSKEAAMALAQANEMAIKSTINAVEILGGHGYMRDHPVEMWMRDALTIAVIAGSTNGQLQTIARTLNR